MRARNSLRPLIAAIAAAALALPVAGFAQEEGGGDLERRVRRLENIVDSGQIARLLQRIESLEQEIRQLRGEIEHLGHRLDELL